MGTPIKIVFRSREEPEERAGRRRAGERAREREGGRKGQQAL
jgi:hypothetical protein